jgi:hypothetical protein
VQRATPPELQGRVYAAADAVITTPQMISIAVAAGLVGIVGYQALLAGTAVANLLGGGYLLGRYGSRVERTHQPREHQRPRPAGVG